MKKNLEFFKKWKEEKGEGIILTYLQGIRKISLEWVLGCLKGDFGFSKKEIVSIIKKIRKNPSQYSLNKFRKIRLKKIELALKNWKKIPSSIFPSVWKSKSK